MVYIPQFWSNDPLDDTPTSADRFTYMELGIEDAAAVADAALSDAGTAQTTANAAIPKALVNAKGDLLVATADDTVARLAVGANDKILTADSSAGAGVAWKDAPATGIPSTLVDVKGDLLVATADNTVARLPAGTNGYALVADSSVAAGLKYAPAADSINGVPIGGSTGEVLVKLSSTDYDTDWVPQTGGGGGVTVHTPPGSPNAKDDEFNDGSGFSGPVNGLDAQWSKHNMGTSTWFRLDNAYAPDAGFFDIPTGQAADQAIYQAVPAGDFRAVARLEFAGASDRQMWALFIVDSAGTGVSLCIEHTVASQEQAVLRDMTTWAQAAGNTNMTAGQASTATRAFASGIPLRLSLRKASGVYSAALTAGDRVMTASILETPRTPTAFTAAYVGIGRIFGTGVGKVAIDYFRIS